MSLRECISPNQPIPPKAIWIEIAHWSDKHDIYLCCDTQSPYKETVQVKFNADTVAPFLGNYQKDWRVELRDDQTLWLVLHNVHEYQLIQLPDGTYIISNNSYLGGPVSFSENDEGLITMSMTTFGTDLVVKID